MKESTSIAYSFAKGLMARKYPDNKFFEKARIHLHCPEGAVQKDGPSAGITMATSLLSLGLDKEVNPTIAMTGELTVTGKVLRIGGLREKTVAAKRAGATMVIFPKDNLSDWLELPEVSAFSPTSTARCEADTDLSLSRTSKQASRANQSPGTKKSSISSSPTSTRPRRTSSGRRNSLSRQRRSPSRMKRTTECLLVLALARLVTRVMSPLAV